MSQSQVHVYPRTEADFNEVVADFKVTTDYKDPLLYAIGKLVKTNKEVVVTVFYPFVNGPKQGTDEAAILMKLLNIKPFGVQTIELSNAMIREVLHYFAAFKNDGTRPNLEVLNMAINKKEDITQTSTSGSVVTFIFDDIEPQSIEDSTLKLYALSNRLFKPNELNLKGILATVPNVAWTGHNPTSICEIDKALMVTAFGDNKHYAPQGFSRFPLYIHRLNPIKMGVSIADDYSIRLGIYLGEGTEIMSGARCVNFKNENGDIVPISIGRNCRLEENCILGIPIGDGVTIEAGVVVKDYSLVRIKVEAHSEYGSLMSAKELAGIGHVIFRRDSLNLLEVSSSDYTSSVY